MKQVYAGVIPQSTTFGNIGKSLFYQYKANIKSIE